MAGAARGRNESRMAEPPRVHLNTDRQEGKSRRSTTPRPLNTEELRRRRREYYTSGHAVQREKRLGPRQPVTVPTEPGKKRKTEDSGHGYVYPQQNLTPESRTRSAIPDPAQGSSKTRRKSAKGLGDLQAYGLPTKQSNHSSSGHTGREKSRTTKTRLDLPRGSRLVECLTCGADDISSNVTAKLRCGHRMCHSCLRRIFVLSTTDPAHMPPRCCSSEHIPLRHVEALFDNRFKRLWNKKYQEYTTSNRIYCPSRKCGHWIKPSVVRVDPRDVKRKYAHCERCGTRVCTACNKRYHKRMPCPDDPETTALIDSAETNGWQRCFSCKAMIELKEGCNHMTCRCTAQFCMLCGLRWKTCDCPWFSHTIAPAGDRLDHMRVPCGPAAARATYADEMTARRRQELGDRLLAIQMRLEELHEVAYSAHAPIRPDSRTRPPPRRDIMPPEADFVVGNATPHHMNESFARSDPSLMLDPSTRTYDLERRGGRHRALGDDVRDSPGRSVAASRPTPDASDPSNPLNAAGMKRQDSNVGRASTRTASFGRISRNGGKAQGAKERRIMGWLSRVEEGGE